MVIPFILDYLKHYWVANTRHGTHSPFVYKLVDEVIYDFSKNIVYVPLENRRAELLKDERFIDVLDLGAGSLLEAGSVVEVDSSSNNSNRGNLRRKSVKAIAKGSLKRPQLAQLLYRIVRNHDVGYEGGNEGGNEGGSGTASNAGLAGGKGTDLNVGLAGGKISSSVGTMAAGSGAFTILELGTCLGLTTAYMAQAKPEASVYTIEGCPQTALIAQANWEALGLDSAIDLRVGNFDHVLPKLANELKRLDVFYIDGNHTEEATWRYFEWALDLVHDDSLIIFDDIYWSPGMKRAWERIKAHPRVTVTIDMFYIGLVYFRKGQAKEDFKIRVDTFF